MGDFTCLNCPDRTVGCHGICEKYKKEKAEHERIKENEYRNRESTRYVIGGVVKYKSDVAKKPKLKYGRHR